MRALLERAEMVGREAAARKIDKLVADYAAKLPRAAIEKISNGISIRELRLIERWLEDSDLRFLSRMGG